MFQNIVADARRITDCEKTVPEKIVALCFHLGFHAVLYYRVASWLHRNRLSLCGVIVGYVASVHTGAQISRKSEIGAGFCVLHPMGVVIGSTTKIGKNATLAGRNCIGQKSKNDERPVIGDNFYAGCGANVFGLIRVGHNVEVGANANLTWSVSDHVRVKPARSIERVGVTTRSIKRVG